MIPQMQRAKWSPWLVRVVIAAASVGLLAALVAPAAAFAAGTDSTGSAWLKAQLLGPRDLPGYEVTGDYGLAGEEVIRGTGSFVDTLRIRTIKGGYVRVLTSFAGDKEVRLRVTEYTNHTYAQSPILDDEPPVSLPGLDIPRARATRPPRTGAERSIHIRFSRGRVGVDLVVTQLHPVKSDGGGAITLLSGDVAKRQFKMLHPSPDLVNDTRISLAGEQRQLVAFDITAVMLVLVLVSAFATIRDRGSRERLFARIGLRPNRVEPDVRVKLIDVSRSARASLRRVRFWMLLRVFLIAVVFVLTFKLSTGRQAALLGLAAVILTLGEMVVARLRGRDASRYPSDVRSVMVGLAGLSLTYALLAGAVILFLLSTVGQLSIRSTGSISETEMRHLVSRGMAVALVLVGLSDLPFRLSRRIWLRRASSLLSWDERPEILLLRSFEDDHLTIRTRRTGKQTMLERLALRRRDGFELVLTWTAWRFGPVTTVGEPGTRVPPFGASRVYYPDGEWLPAVRAKLLTCSAVILVMGRTETVLDEVAEVRQSGSLLKTLFLLPPVASSERLTRIDLLSQALDLDPRILRRVEEGGRAVLSLNFDSFGLPVIAIGEARDDVSYDVALGLAIQRAIAGNGALLYRPAETVRVRSPRPATVATKSLSVTDRRRRTRRRAWTLAPWIGALILSMLSGIADPLPPKPPVPGHLLTQKLLSYDISVDGNGQLVCSDLSSGRLIVYSQGGAITSASPLPQSARVVAFGNLGAYVTTGPPYAVVGLRRTASGYVSQWTLHIGSPPAQLALWGDRLFVALPEIGELAAIDVDRGVLLKRIKVGRGPWSVASSARFVFVGNITDYTVTRVNPRSLAVAGTTELYASPSNLDIDRNRLLVVSIADGSISAYDLPSLRMTRKIETARPNGVVATLNDRLFFGTYGSDPRLIEYSLSSGDKSADHRVPVEIGQLVASRGNLLASLPGIGRLTLIFGGNL